MGISIRENLNALPERKPELGAEEKSRYDLLEKVPDWQNKLKRWEFAKFILKEGPKGYFKVNHSDQAEPRIAVINEKFGEGSATGYEPSKDALGATVYRIIINTPHRSEFSDILGDNDELLPRSN